MRQGGQRQDAVYLGVAVGVLVIAFLIIVGARALSPSPSRKKKPDSTAQADTKSVRKPTQKPKLKDGPKAAPGQTDSDPFLSASKPDRGREDPYGRNRNVYGGSNVSARSGRNGRPGPEPVEPVQPEDAELTLELVGVIQGGTPLAIIRDGDRRYQLRVGDMVGDYRLAKISTNRVVVTRGGKSYTVDLQATRRSNSASSVRRPVARPSSRPVRRR